MASCGKQRVEPSGENKSPQTLVYSHNSEEFIDIHGSHCNSNIHTFSKDTKSFAEKNGDGDEQFDSADASKNGDFLYSSNSRRGLKLPVQETEGVASGVTVEYCNNSDDDYESAEEGEDDECKSESESDDFIPDETVLQSDRTVDAENAFSANTLLADDNDEADVSDNEEPPQENEGKDISDPLEARRKLEESLTDEEKQERKGRSQKMKDEGNVQFRSCQYDEAILSYTEALDVCPLECHKERSIMFANRAACKMKQELYEEAIADSTSALELHPHYLKALLRRAELYEKTEKLDEALKDYQKALELDPSQHGARAACLRLAEQIKVRNEKMKEEMMGKLKDLGDMVLRPFGLSVNNFNLQQDPETGSYSVQFKQNPGNGS